MGVTYLPFVCVYVYYCRTVVCVYYCSTYYKAVRSLKRCVYSNKFRSNSKLYKDKT